MSAEQRVERRTAHYAGGLVSTSQKRISAFEFLTRAAVAAILLIVFVLFPLVAYIP